MYLLSDCLNFVAVFAVHDRTTPTPLPPPSHGRKNSMRAMMSKIVARARG